MTTVFFSPGIRDYDYADFLVLVFLTATAWVLFAPYIDAPGLGTDMYSYLRESYIGEMPWGSLESHRPFRTIAWNLACLVAGYSKNGLHAVSIVLTLLASVLVYLIVRELLPHYRSLALAAAALRLTWTTAIYESTNEMIIEALFPEVLFLVATFILLVLEKRNLPRSARYAGRFAIAFLVYAAMGTYEQVWGNILLLPLILVISSAVSFQNRKSFVNLLAWYGAATAFLISYFAYFGHFGKPPTKFESPELYFAIWGTITSIVTIETAVHLLAAARVLVHDVTVWVAISATAVFVLLYARLQANEPEPSGDAKTTKRVLTAAVTWFMLCYLHLVAGLASNYGDVAAWGSRYALSTSYPVILLIFAVTITGAGACRSKRRVTRYAVLSVLTLAFFGNASLIVEDWDTIATRRSLMEEMHKALTQVVPAVKPGTVLLIEGPEFLEDTYETKLRADVIHTFTLRNLYGVRDLYAFFHTPEYPVVEANGTVRVRVGLVYPVEKEDLPSYTGIGIDYRFLHPQRWHELNPGSDETREIAIDSTNIVRLRYHDRRFEVVDSKSNMDRIRWDIEELHKRILGIDEDFVEERSLNMKPESPRDIETHRGWYRPTRPAAQQHEVPPTPAQNTASSLLKVRSKLRRDS